MNRVILCGRLTRDPDVKYTQSGKCFARFTLAVNDRFSKEKKADFIPIVVWNKTAEIAGNYLVRGSQTLIAGSLKTRDYTDKQGDKHYVTEVLADQLELLGKKPENAGANTGQSVSSAFGRPVSTSPNEIPYDEEIPF